MELRNTNVIWNYVSKFVFPVKNNLAEIKFFINKIVDFTEL